MSIQTPVSSLTASQPVTTSNQSAADASPLPNAQQIASQIDLTISLCLSLWPALSTAVQNQWGGPSSADKRDFLAGSISTVFAERPDTDEEDIEEILFNYMADEFDCQLDDESEMDVAAQICAVRRHCLEGDFTGVKQIHARWIKREESRRGGEVQMQRAPGQEDDDSEDESDGGVEVDVDMGGVDRDGDVSMDGPSQTLKREVEVDEDGFTKVVGRRKR